MFWFCIIIFLRLIQPLKAAALIVVTPYGTMYANSEDFQVLAITTMVSSFVAEYLFYSEVNLTYRYVPSPEKRLVYTNTSSVFTEVWYIFSPTFNPEA